MVFAEKLSTLVGLDLDKANFDKGMKESQQYLDRFKKRLNSIRGQRLAGELAELRVRAKELNQALKNATNKEQRINIQTNIEQVKKEITVANARLKNFVERGNSGTSGLKKRFSDVGKSIKSMALSLVAITEIFSYFRTGLQDARGFEKGLSRINTVARVSKEEMKTYGKEVKAISERLPVATNELLDASFDIVSAGVNFEHASKILELSAQTAVGANTNTKTAFEGIIAILKGYNLELGEAGRVADLFFKTNELGQTTIGEVASYIQQVGVTAKNSGVQLEELFAIYSTATGVTGKANEVTTQLKGLLNSISAPTKEASTKMSELGIEYGAATIRAKGLIPVIQDIVDKVGGNREALRRLIPETQALLLAETLATSQSEKYASALGKLEGATGSLRDAVAEMVDDDQAQLALAENRWSNYRQKVGANILIMLGELSKYGLVAGEFFDLLAALINQGVQSFVFFGKATGAVVSDLATFIPKMLLALSKNVKVIFSNMAHNAGQVFGEGITGTMQIALNSMIGLMEDGVNKALGFVDQISGLLSKVGVNIGTIGKVGLGRVDFGASFDFKPLTSGANNAGATIEASFDKTRKVVKEQTANMAAAIGLVEAKEFALGDALNKGVTINDVKIGIIDDQLKSLGKTIDDTNINDIFPDNTGDGGGSKKSKKEIDKVAGSIAQYKENLSEAQKELNNAIAGSKEFHEAQEKVHRAQDNLNFVLGKEPQALKDIKEKAEEMGEGIEDAIEKSDDVIDVLKNSISDLKDEIKNFDSDLSGLGDDLLDRYIDIKTKLSDTDLAYDERKKLEEELSLIEGNTTAEARKEAERYDALNSTERILEEIQAIEVKKIASQEALVQKEQELAKEQAIQESAKQNLIELEKLYAKEVQDNSLLRILAIKDEIKTTQRLIQLRNQLSGKSGSSIASSINLANARSGSSNNTTTITSGDQNVTIQANGADAQEVGRIVEKILKDASQASRHQKV